MLKTFLKYCILMLFLTMCKENNLPIEDSPQAETQQQSLNKAGNKRISDLSRFIKMDNPEEAAQALQEFIKENNLSLDTYPPSNSDDPQSSQNDRWLIHLFNESEFTPEPGIDPELKVRASASTENAGDNNRTVVLLQFEEKMAIGNVLHLLQSGIKVYDQVGDKTFIARLPNKNVENLQAQEYIRWLGLYKAEFKYSANTSQSKMPGAFIYPLGGDKPEYRAELEQLGIAIRGYDTSAFFYDVVLDVSQFEKVAQLWWIKGILKELEINVEVNNN